MLNENIDRNSMGNGLAKNRLLITQYEEDINRLNPVYQKIF